MADAVRRGDTYDINLFCISKSLTREPEQYKDANLPHVRVAQRMKERNEPVRSGDLIPYVICAAKDGDAASGKVSDRAFHLEEVRRDESMNVDVSWYLENQLFPPVMRLCEHIDGFTATHLSDAMGIRNAQVNDVVERAHVSDAAEEYCSAAFSAATLEERFPLADQLFMPCARCKQQVRVQPHEHVKRLLETAQKHDARKHKFRRKLYVCSTCFNANPNNDNSALAIGHLRNAIVVELRRHTAEFFANGAGNAQAMKLRQQIAYFRALFDEPVHYSSPLEREAHQNVLRCFDYERDKYGALCDRDHLEFPADMQNAALKVVDDMYKEIAGVVLDTTELFV
jgi:DNA polymerase alpha subunit A